ncbi:hypothetical protein FDP41_007983 [Naegleria fowleri]|uniref:O-phosphoseryl-tRNA(Sec) selenium transferase n=1 Tax=Naegleria fowleri TaxID=5763 RepID=A0A6A5CF85_NAEFO|nr:uncharacterized protein FDP41_007983 [Naegleria fowleri]KAF0984068.1 hypothetical protein FDP41_007983 [Naegleria fowleri]CAG4714920.1 unnamed protein product [Naegleria fowleri]
MNFEEFGELASQLIQANHAKQALQALNKQQKMFKTLLSQRLLPKEGYSDQQIEALLSLFASMDTNNYENHTGIGEREGRVFSNLVMKRHFHLSHGIGRSGELTSNQPKAAGSSMILQLTNYLVNHALQIAGCRNAKKSIVVPMCTGMTLSLCLRTLANDIKQPNKKFVIWPRIDQQSVLKSIDTAGLVPLVIENIVNEDGSIEADIPAIEKKIQEVGVENILCVLSTTSCFAPRVPDNVFEIGKICHKYQIGHIVNNAYGVQSKIIMENINKTIASSKSTITCFVQSTDKNFMVPVGGAVVASGGECEEFVDKVSKLYAGRANMSPILDLFMTLLSMGERRWKELLSEREELFQYFISKFKTEETTPSENSNAIHSSLSENSQSSAIHVHTKQSLTVNTTAPSQQLITGSNSRNQISFALSLHLSKEQALRLGGRLFYRNCTGPRVVLKDTTKTVVGIDFVGYGAHTNEYPHHYITLACAIGIQKCEIDSFFDIFNKEIGTLTTK